MAITDLPPLAPLRAFQAAARLGNFTRAGRELGLSQAAVSQHVRTLERDLGVALFVRRHRSVEPTNAGRSLFHSVHAALEMIAGSAREIRRGDSLARLRVAADLSFAHYWLLPRIAGFVAAHPHVTPSIVSSDDEAECLHEDVDAAMLFGTGAWRGREARLILEEEVFPVCSPVYAATQGPLTLADLGGHVLLDLDGRWDWMRWRQWLSAVGQPMPATARLREFNSWPLLTDAAVASQGIGLGWRHLSDDLLASGALLRPFEQTVRTGRGYYLVTRAPLSEAAGDFCDWLVREASADPGG